MPADLDTNFRALAKVFALTNGLQQPPTKPFVDNTNRVSFFINAAAAV